MSRRLELRKATELVDVPPATIRRWIQEGNVKGWIPADEVKIQGRASRHWLVDREDLLAYTEYLSSHSSLSERLKQWVEQEARWNVRNTIDFIRQTVQRIPLRLSYVILFIALSWAITQIPSPLQEPAQRVTDTAFDIVDGLLAVEEPPLAMVGLLEEPPVGAVLMPKLSGGTVDEELHLNLTSIKDAENIAGTGIGLVLVSTNEQREMLRRRQLLRIPTDFMPEAESLAFLNFVELDISGPSQIAIDETAIFTATVSLDQSMVTPADPMSLVTTTPDRIRFSRILHAKLDGVDFDIQPPGDDPQPQMVSLDGETRWSWQVRAKKRGQQRPLTVQLFAAAMDEIEGSERWVLLRPSVTKYINVSQPLSDQVAGSNFVQGLVIPIAGAILTGVAAAFITWYSKRQQQKSLEEKVKDLEIKLIKLRQAHNIEQQETQKDD